MTMSRLPVGLIHDLEFFIQQTALTWMSEGFIKQSPYGVEILVAGKAGDDFTDAAVYLFGEEQYKHPDPTHTVKWYQQNAHGKNIACLTAGMDSHEAVRLYQGALAEIEGIFPWGGGVIDSHYGVIVGVSGFKEDEDILLARTIRNFIVMWMDRHGQAYLDDARRRGEPDGETGRDRFTVSD